MVVVVQFLTTDQDAERKDIGAGVGRIEIAVAPEVPESVDHAGRPERNPGDLRQPHREARGRPEQRHVDAQHDEDAELLVGRIEMPLDPVVRRAVAVAPERFKVLRLSDVKEDAGPQDAVDAVDLRAVRIFRRFDLGVMLAMNSRPLLGSHAGGQPQPEAEEVRGQGMQIERPMRLVPVQEDGHRGDRHMGQAQGHEHISPPRPIDNTNVHKTSTRDGFQF